MSAYILVDIQVHDAARYERYKRMAEHTVGMYGGRYVARGARTEALEGDWETYRFVMLEFPDSERARAWWSSPEYAEAKALRHETADSKMLLVEGL
jgi:uncharacterized protein (DUF1330 family)